MILSLEKNFLLLSPTKTASTSLEEFLRPYGQLVLTRTEYGKHWSLAQVQRVCGPLIDKCHPRPFTFMVVRDPFDRLLSLYRSHMGDRFADRPTLTTQGMSAEDFIGYWCLENASQVKSQAQMGIGLGGKFVPDFLIDFDQLDDQFAAVLGLIDVSSSLLPHSNQSQADRDSLLNSDWNFVLLQRFASRRYAVDRLLKDRFTGRLLSDVDRLQITKIWNEGLEDDAPIS